MDSLASDSVAQAAVFTARAAPLGVIVERVASVAAAADTVTMLAREVGVEHLVIAAELGDAAPELVAAIESTGVSLARAGNPADTRDAPLGLSLARLAVAETGSVLVAERTPADRGIGMLVANHVVVCPTAALVASLDEAAPVLREIASRPGGGYATLVTGPSRTADIERVLTVGVQGPARLAVLFVDDLR
jgi:L-lactate dehydrogenase complex protein LldG